MSRVLSTLTRHGRSGHRHLSRSPQHIIAPQSYFDDNDDDENIMHQHNNSIAPPSYLSSPRQYHTTSRKEILPFIAAGVVLGGAVCEYISAFRYINTWYAQIKYLAIYVRDLISNFIIYYSLPK